MNHNRMLAYGAMMTALFGLMLILNRLTGQVLENFLIYAYPMPLLVFCDQYGTKSGLMVYVAMAGMAFVLSTPSGFIIAIGQAAIGMIYGSMMHHGLSNTWALIVTMAASAVLAYLEMIVFAGFFGYDNEADIAAAGEMLKSMLNFFHIRLQAGVDTHALLEQAMRLAAVLAGAIDGLLIHMLAEILLKRLHLHKNHS